ncbi:MAG: hypothetical protein QOD75_156 [Blastocatellia bacterium]|nr:hypothetical protein [Blastocatellia bacterium]
MNRIDLDELAANPDLISGIYNYCDRWCERCPFTSRCLVYATEQADHDYDDPETRDINNARFWEKLGSVLQQAHEMIAEWAAEAGVDLAEIDQAAIEEERQQREAAKNDALAVAARNYAQATNEWFASEIVADVHDDLRADSQTETLGVPVEDAIEVIRWYQFFIAAKIMRAGPSESQELNATPADEAGELVFEQRTDEDPEDLQAILDEAARHDSDGSAKAALIAIDRSMIAWRSLYTSLPDKAATIMPLVASLERLRGATETAFPDARDFMRPGFDETFSEFVS